MNDIPVFHINIVYGDDKTKKLFYFVHKDYKTLDLESQKAAFNDAVQELNHIYSYGRFATIKGVLSLFKDFGFEQTIP